MNITISFSIHVNGEEKRITDSFQFDEKMAVLLVKQRLTAFYSSKIISLQCNKKELIDKQEIGSVGESATINMHYQGELATIHSSANKYFNKLPSLNEQRVNDLLKIMLFDGLPAEVKELWETILPGVQTIRAASPKIAFEYISFEKKKAILLEVVQRLPLQSVTQPMPALQASVEISLEHMDKYDYGRDLPTILQDWIIRTLISQKIEPQGKDAFGLSQSAAKYFNELTRVQQLELKSLFLNDPDISLESKNFVSARVMVTEPGISLNQSYLFSSRR